MGEPFIGSEALAAGTLSRHELRTRFFSLHRDIYIPNDVAVSHGGEDGRAVEYDGDQHRTDRRQYVKDIRRGEIIERLGWLVVRVVAEDRPDHIIQRVRDARARRM